MFCGTSRGKFEYPDDKNYVDFNPKKIASSASIAVDDLKRAVYLEAYTEIISHLEYYSRAELVRHYPVVVPLPCVHESPPPTSSSLVTFCWSTKVGASGMLG
jgi:hypothetical protein